MPAEQKVLDVMFEATREETDILRKPRTRTPRPETHPKPETRNLEPTPKP